MECETSQCADQMEPTFCFVRTGALLPLWLLSCPNSKEARLLKTTYAIKKLKFLLYVLHKDKSLLSIDISSILVTIFVVRHLVL